MTLAVLLTLAAVIAYFGINAHRATGSAINGSSKVAARFIDDLNQGDYAHAETLLSSSARFDNPAETLKKAMATLQRNHGSLVGSSLIYSDPRNVAGLDTCKLIYRLQYTAGTGKLSLILVRSYEGWRIDSVLFG